MVLKNDNLNETILHLACQSSSVDVVKYLISLNKFDINAVSIFI